MLENLKPVVRLAEISLCRPGSIAFWSWARRGVTALWRNTLGLILP